VGGAPGRVPIRELVDLEALARGGAPPSPSAIRAALPRGWVLEEDGAHARRDLRLFFREGWILVVGLVAFGSAGAAFLWGALPRGWGGLARFLLMVLVLLLCGGLVGPHVARTLNRRTR
jgi:hypothetical protein